MTGVSNQCEHGVVRGGWCRACAEPTKVQRVYNYPVFGTQGGGLVREVNKSPFTYVFVEKPDCSGLDVGDMMPKEWDIIPANQAARDLIGHEQWMDSD